MSRPLDHNSFPGLHQQSDIHTSPLAFWSCTVGAGLVLAYLVHGVLLALNYPVLSIFEVLWNCFVWLMPSSLVLPLGPSISASLASKGLYRGMSGSSEHAAKSEILRNVFKFNTESKPATAFADSPPGLGNWDNSCYQNSVLQALASLRCLTTFFEHLRQNITDLPDDTTVASLNDFINSLNDISNSGRHLWAPHKLKSMSSWQQQDAQEYFSKLVDAIEKDTAAAVKTNENNTDARNSSSLLSVVSSAEEDEEQLNGIQSGSASHIPAFAPRRYAQLQNPLEGLLAQRVGCTRCGYSEGISLIPFNCITLPLGRKWSYEIQDCFEEYTSLEAIEGVECAKCSLTAMEHELRRQNENLASMTGDGQNRSNEDLEKYKVFVSERLEAVNEALRDEDFSEATVRRKCQIPSNRRVTSTKSKQVTIMKPPQCLVMHVNRSLFDEQTGAQLKNYADVQYPSIFDMSRWCIGKTVKVDLNDQLSTMEEWEMNPTRSMIAGEDSFHRGVDCRYELRAVITHLGRHENGHYICYRNLDRTDAQIHDTARILEEEFEKDSNAWWRLSDENVSPVSDEEAFSQGGAFMLFYERMDQPRHCPPTQRSVPCEEAKPAAPIYESLDTIGTHELHKNATVYQTLDLCDEVMGVNISPTSVDEAAQSKLPDEALAFVESENSSNDAMQSISSNPLQDDILGLAEHDKEEASTDSAAEFQNRSLSPPKMRTAGIQRRTSQSSEPFKAIAMVATT